MSNSQTVNSQNSRFYEFQVHLDKLFNCIQSSRPCTSSWQALQLYSEFSPMQAVLAAAALLPLCGTHCVNLNLLQLSVPCWTQPLLVRKLIQLFLHCVLASGAVYCNRSCLCVFVTGGWCPNLTTASSRAVFATLWALFSLVLWPVSSLKNCYQNLVIITENHPYFTWHHKKSFTSFLLQVGWLNIAIPETLVFQYKYLNLENYSANFIDNCKIYSKEVLVNKINGIIKINHSYDNLYLGVTFLGHKVYSLLSGLQTKTKNFNAHTLDLITPLQIT